MGNSKKFSCLWFGIRYRNVHACWIVYSNFNITQQPTAKGIIQTRVGKLVQEIFDRVLVLVRIKLPAAKKIGTRALMYNMCQADTLSSQAVNSWQPWPTEFSQSSEHLPKFEIPMAFSWQS